MIGQHKRDITVVPYRSGWKDLFEHEAGLLRLALGDEALGIEHIGSTAIPGMAAKPIIDIMIAVVSLDRGAELISVVEGLGYIYKPHDTVPERLFFAKETKPEYRTHHLNLTSLGSGFWKNQLLFRDYLRAHQHAALEYGELKKQLAADSARTGHLDPEGKTEFVTRILDLAKIEENHWGVNAAGQ